MREGEKGRWKGVERMEKGREREGGGSVEKEGGITRKGCWIGRGKESEWEREREGVGEGGGGGSGERKRENEW